MENSNPFGTQERMSDVADALVGSIHGLARRIASTELTKEEVGRINVELQKITKLVESRYRSNRA